MNLLLVNQSRFFLLSAIWLLFFIAQGMAKIQNEGWLTLAHFKLTDMIFNLVYYTLGYVNTYQLQQRCCNPNEIRHKNAYF